LMRARTQPLRPGERSRSPRSAATKRKSKERHHPFKRTRVG
jgi:hypothetical protein